MPVLLTIDVEVGSGGDRAVQVTGVTFDAANVLLGHALDDQSVHSSLASLDLSTPCAEHLAVILIPNNCNKTYNILAYLQANQIKQDCESKSWNPNIFKVKTENNASTESTPSEMVEFFLTNTCRDTQVLDSPCDAGSGHARDLTGELHILSLSDGQWFQMSDDLRGFCHCRRERELLVHSLYFHNLISVY